MLFAPALCLLLAIQPPPAAVTAPGAELEKRMDELRRSGNWSGLADYFEAMPAQKRTEYLFLWLDALEHCGRWGRILEAGASGAQVPARVQGRALAELGRPREALACYLAAGKHGDLMAYFEGSNLAQSLSDWKTAEACADGLLERNPTNGTYLAMKGEALARQGRFTEAEVTLNEAVHLVPKRAISWADLACCYNEQARYQDAFEAASKALALVPKLMEGLCNRGRAAIGLKRYKEGRDDYAAALVLVPKDSLVARNLKVNITMADAYLAYQGAKPSKRPGVKP